MSPAKKDKKEGKSKAKEMIKLSEEDQQLYLKAFEKHKDKNPFDIPVKIIRHDESKPSNTTINKEIKKLKCALIVNVASNCGHTSKHYKELTDLHKKYKEKGF